MRRDDWETPQWLFDHLDAEFGFVLDACAEEHNAKCRAWLGNCLNGSWPGAPGAAFLNPPYAKDELSPILERAVLESSARPVVALLPVRTEMVWWHELVLPWARELRFLRGRVAFVPPPGHTLSPNGNRPVYSSVVVVYRGCELVGAPAVSTIVARPNRNLGRA
jgi:site-specific DNA-methyltransferase (adenine-specific)